MFDHHAPGVHRPVGALLFGGERVFLGGLVRLAGVGMELLQTLVAGVGKHLHARMHTRLAAFKEVEVVPPAFTHAHGQDASAAPLQEHLRFQRVTALLARVAGALLFFGRSQAHSPTSTTTPCQRVSLRKACLRVR